MVQNNQLDDETIDKLVIVFKRAMAKMATAIRESKAIETLKSMEVFNKQKEKLYARMAYSLVIFEHRTFTKKVWFQSLQVFQSLYSNYTFTTQLLTGFTSLHNTCAFRL